MQLGANQRVYPSSAGTVTFEFRQFNEDDIGPEILAIKKALSVSLVSSQYSDYPAPKIDSSDGPHFDAKMILAVKAYQAGNRDYIVNILRDLERHSDPETAFQDQFGTMSRATLASLHGYDIETGNYDEQGSPLYNACGNIVDQAIALQEATVTANSLEGRSQNQSISSDNDLQEMIRDIDRHTPSLTPTPREIIPGKAEIALRTGYTLQNPPPEVNGAFFESSEYLNFESEALQRTFAFYNKKPTFNMRNDSEASTDEGLTLSTTAPDALVRVFPLLRNYARGIDISFTVSDPTAPNYLPAKEREVNRTSFQDKSNLVSFHKLAAPPPNNLEAPYMIVFTINVTKLESIHTPVARGREFNVLEAYAEAKSTYEDVKDLADKLGLTGGENFVEGFHKKAQGRIDQYHKRWQNAKTEFSRKSTKDQLATVHGALDKKFGINEAIRRRSLRNRLDTQKKILESDKKTTIPLPGPEGRTISYDLSGLENRATKVAAKMREYHMEYIKLTGGGKDVRFDPPVNLETEADRLVNLYSALEGFIRQRGAHPKKKNLEILFKLTDDGKGVKITKLEIVEYEHDGRGKLIVKERQPLADIRNNNPRHSPFNKNPYNDRVAAGYLYGLNDIYKEINLPGLPDLGIDTPADAGDSNPISDFLKKCSEITGLGALSFVTKYRLPRADFRVSSAVRKGPKDPDFDIDTNIPGQLYSSDQKIKKFADETANKIGEGNFFSVRNGKVFRIEDAFPLGELCNLKDLQNELINKFNWQALLCDMYACIPDIRPLPPLDLDFDIPDLPDLSTFDPMKIIRPIIEAALMDLLKQFLCSLVNAILNIIRDPSCEDLYDLAARGLVSLIDILKGSGANNLSAKMTIVDALRNAGVPPELYASEDGLGHTPNTVSSLFNDISQLLTASQICSLLQGEPSQDILDLIEITMSESHPDLVKYFYGTEDIKSLFLQLGALIDPEICRTIVQRAEETAAEKICSDSIVETLKKELEEKGVAKDALLKAIEDVKGEAIRRSEAFRALFSGNPVEKIMKNAEFPGSPATEMPAFLKDMINNRVGAIADSLRSSLRLDSQSYIEGLYDQLVKPLDQDSEQFNSFMAFKFYRSMAILAKMNEEGLMVPQTEDNPDTEFQDQGKLDIRKLWSLREYLYSDDSILELAPDGEQNTDNFLEFPYPPVEGVETKRYKIGDVTIDKESGEKVRAFIIDENCDITNSNRGESDAKPNRPFARPIISGVVVGKDGNNKVPHRIEVGEFYTREQEQSSDRPKNRDLMLPGFPLKDSGILEGGGRGSVSGIPFELFLGSLTQELMNDITPKIAELQSDILNHINSNMEMKFNNELLPAIKSVFSVDEEAAREALARGTEVPNRFRETVTFSQDNTGATIVFALPDVGTGAVDSLVEYREIPSEQEDTPDTYQIKLSEENFTGEEMIITGIDCALPRDDLESGRYQPLIGGANKKIQEFANLAKESFTKGINDTFNSQEDKNVVTTLLNLNVEGQTFHSIIGAKRASFYEVLFESILSLYKQSNIFDNQYVQELAGRLLRSEYVDGQNCLIQPVDVFGVDELGSLIASRIQEEFKSPDFDPFSYDFSTPGPIEKGLIYGLVEFLIRIYVIEFALRSAITMTSFSNIETLKQDSFIRVLSTYISTNLLEIVGEEVAEIVLNSIKDVTGQQDEELALKELVTKQITDITEKINFVFSNETIDINMQTNFLNTLDSTFAVAPDIPQNQLGSKEFKMTVGSNKPFFYLEKYFKYDGDGSLVEAFKRVLKERLTMQIINVSKRETISETPNETQVTEEQFRNFGGEEEAERIMNIVMSSDDVKNVFQKVQEKIDDKKPEVEYYSPKEIQTYFNELVVDMEDERSGGAQSEVEDIREPLEIDEAATFVNTYPIKHIKRERIHIKVNSLKNNGFDDIGYNMSLVRTPEERQRVLENWQDLAAQAPEMGREDAFVSSFREPARYYKIETTLHDIFEELQIEKTADFFSNDALEGNEQFRELVRKFYDISNGVRNLEYPNRDNPREKRGLTLKDIRYTAIPSGSSNPPPEAEVKYYNQNDLNPETNPTVIKLTEEQFTTEISRISDAQSDLGINNRVYEIWTEYVFHVENFPCFEFGEMLDPIDVLPDITLGEFMEACGITKNSGNKKGIEKFGVSSNGTFYEFTDSALEGIKEMHDNHTAKVSEAFDRKDQIDVQKSVIETFRNIPGADEVSGPDLTGTARSLLEAAEEALDRLTNNGTWSFEETIADLGRRFESKKAEWLTANSAPREVINKLISIYASPATTVTGRPLPSPKNLALFKGLIKIDLLPDGDVFFTQKFLDLMMSDIEKLPFTKGFFDKTVLDFEQPLDTILTTMPLSRANTGDTNSGTGLDLSSQKRRLLHVPMKVLCRRIDYMVGDRIKDTQLAIGHRLPQVLRPIKIGDNFGPMVEQKKTILKEALLNLCAKFKAALFSQNEKTKIYSIDQLFQDYYQGMSDLDSRSFLEDPLSRQGFTPAYFTINRLYEEAARMQSERGRYKFGTYNNYTMGTSYRIKGFDFLFRVNSLHFVKSPVRKPMVTSNLTVMGYYDTYVTLQKINEIIHPKFEPVNFNNHFQGLFGGPVALMNLNTMNLNTHQNDVYSVGTEYRSQRPNISKLSINGKMFLFLMNYLVDFVDRRTLQGIYGTMSTNSYKEFLIDNQTRQSVQARQDKLRQICSERGAFNIFEKILDKGINSPQFYLKQDYNTISMIYADGNSKGMLHPFAESDNEGKRRAVLSSLSNFGTRHDMKWRKFKVKDPIGSDFLVRFDNMLYSGNQSLGFAQAHAREFRVQMNIRNSIQLRQLFTVRALDKILSPTSVDVSIKSLIRAAFYNVVIEDLMFGVRLVGVLNTEDSNEIYDFFGVKKDYNAGHVSFENMSKETKSYFVKYQDILNEEHPRVAIPFAFFEKKFGGRCIDTMDLVKSYNESFQYLKQELAKQTNYKRLMSFVFPLERIFDVCMIYSMFVLSMKPELATIMNTAKSELLSNIAMMDKIPSLNYANTEGTVVSDVVKACTPALIETMEQNHGSDGFSLGDLGGVFEQFGKILARQAKEFLIKVPRTLAQATDPAYREMKRKVDSCQLDGITYSQFQPWTGTRELTRGVTTDRTYAPINVAFPLDFYSSFVPFPPYLINPPQFKSSLVKLSNFIINSGILPPEAQLIRDLGGNCGPLGDSKNAYGAFMLGPAALAMGVNELAGDMGKYKTECPAPAFSMENEYIEPSPCDDGINGGSGTTEPADPSTVDRCAPRDKEDSKQSKDDNSCNESSGNSGGTGVLPS